MTGRVLHQLLAASAAARPENVAIIDGERTLSYGELDARSSQLANLLRDLAGVRRGDRVAIFADKSLEAVIGIYGALKAGAAYVPLDPSAPPGRLAYIVANCSISALVSVSDKQDAWSEVLADCDGSVRVVCLNAPPRETDSGGAEMLGLLGPVDLDKQSTSVPDAGVTSLDLAYILYTSGSTGRPKGVMLSHANGLAFVEWACQEFELTSSDRLSAHAPLHFDLSIFDLFAAASAGSTLVLVPPVTSIFPTEVRRFIETHGITVWYSVPSVLSSLARQGGLKPGDLPSLRTVLFAGEVFPTPYLRMLMEQLPKVRFANLYGPTETNVCTWYEVPTLPPEQLEAIPIGRAIADDEVLVVTDDGRLAALGEVGELYVRGGTVMQGYWGDPDRTGRTLLRNPVGAASGGPVYRTGDLVSVDEAGNLRFIGRRDNQIKSRGYRIELGDIEAALHAHPAVSECAAVAIPDVLITNRLKAFVVLSEAADPAEIRRRCLELLPAYMVPETIEVLTELPKTSTGKIDRRSLAATAAGADPMGGS